MRVSWVIRRAFSLLLLGGGIVLLVLGLNADDPTVSARGLGFSPADRGTWLTALGVVCTIAGGLSFLFQRGA